MIIHILMPIFFAYQGTDLGKKHRLYIFVKNWIIVKLLLAPAIILGSENNSQVFIWFMRW